MSFGNKHVTRRERVGVGRYRFYHTVGHDQIIASVIFLSRGTVLYYVARVTSEYFDIAFTDSRNGNPVEYTRDYHLSVFISDSEQHLK